MTGRLVYDGDCGFCTSAAHRIDPDPVAWQDLDLVSVGATPDQAATYAGWLAEGRITRLGAPAIGAALVARGGWWRWAGRLIDAPLVRVLARIGYRLVARHRYRLPGSTCGVPPDRLNE